MKDLFTFLSAVLLLSSCFKSNHILNMADSKIAYDQPDEPVDYYEQAKCLYNQFVSLVDDCDVTQEELIDFCRAHSSQLEEFPLAHYVVQVGDTELLQAMLEFDLELGSRSDVMGIKPIHVAAKYGDKDIINLLISKLGENVLLQVDKNGNTVFHHACSPSSYSLETIQFLISKHQVSNLSELKNKNDSNLLHAAIYHKNVELAEYFINEYPEMISGVSKGLTPIHLAVISNLPTVIERLIYESNKSHYKLMLTQDDISKLKAKAASKKFYEVSKILDSMSI